MPILLRCISVIGLLGLSSLSGSFAAPAAYVERAFGLSMRYPLYGTAELELPLELPLPADISLNIIGTVAQVEGNIGFGAELGVKALLLPSLVGNPPIALALGISNQFSLVDGNFGWRTGLGPIVSFDLSPIVASFSATPSIGSGGFTLRYGLNLRYYLDPLTITSSLDGDTNGGLQLGVGLRYLF